MNDLRRAAEMALKRLDMYFVEHGNDDDFEATQALRQALAETDHFRDATKMTEPVAWMYVNKDGECEQIEYGEPFDDPSVTPLYMAPLKKEWVGLTADEIWKCNKAETSSAVEFHICSAHQNVMDFAEAIEAKLKEKNFG